MSYNINRDISFVAKDNVRTVHPDFKMETLDT